MAKAYLIASLSIVEGAPYTRYFISSRPPDGLSTNGIEFFLVAFADGETEEVAKNELRKKLEVRPVFATLFRSWLKKRSNDAWDDLRSLFQKAAKKLGERNTGKRKLTPEA